MPKVGQSRKKTPGSGRKKGVPNKTTANVKQALTEAFEKLGGVSALSTWAASEPGEFYKLWAKLLPQDVHAMASGTFVIEMVNFDQPSTKDERAKNTSP